MSGGLLYYYEADRSLWTPNLDSGGGAVYVRCSIDSAPCGVVVFCFDTSPAPTTRTGVSPTSGTGILGLAYGGTGANLSATGGANQIVKQLTLGGPFTVAALVAAEIPSLDTSKLTTGTLPVARGGTGVTSSTGTVAVVLSTNPALVGPTTDTIQTSGHVGIGVAPNATAGRTVDILDTGDYNTIFEAKNADASGTAASANFRAVASTAVTNIIAHGAGRTATRYGVTVASYSEVLAVSGNGLLIGTSTNANPIIFGTNGLERMRISGAGLLTVLAGATVSGAALTVSGGLSVETLAVTSSPVTLTQAQIFAYVNTDAARTVNLPASPATGEVHIVKDNTGTGAATNNITVSGNGKNIDGAASHTINTDRAAFTYIYNSVQWSIV